MMTNFTYANPTMIHFGKGQITHLADLKDHGKKVLLVYGGGSIKRAGLYDQTLSLLQDAGMTVFECAGVEPNPRIETVRRGAVLCKKEGIELVLAVGGGSVIDCAKVIAAAACYDGDAWDLILQPSNIQGALPIFTVLTLSATGSEMNSFAVISDLSKNDKLATFSPYISPTMSILDPTYTFSVSKRQTAAGSADIMSHILENYFTNVEHADVQARFCEGLLKVCIKYAPIALEYPDNYDARANLMWCSSLGIHDLLSAGAEVDWCVHPMEHELSAFYDVTHGEGLAILTPSWMEHILSEKTVGRFVEYGVNVWGLDKNESPMTIAQKAIQCTREFFRCLGLPSTLSAVGIDRTHFDIMAEKSAASCTNSYVPLTKEDVLAIFNAAQ